MNIAFFHNLPSGGAKRSAYELVKRMSINHTVDLYIYADNKEDFLDLRPFVRKTFSFVRYSKAAQIGNIRFKKIVRQFSFLSKLRNVSMQMAKMINEGGYDLAFVMQCKSINSPFILRYLKIPSIYFCHEPFAKNFEPHYHFARLPFYKRFLSKWMHYLDISNARCATMILANSLYSRETLYREFGIYPCLNYLGVDPTHFRPLGIERDKMVLSVGTLNIPLKAQDFIIKSIATLNEKPIVHFIYNFDSGEHLIQLKELGQRLGVQIEFECLPTDDDLVVSYNKCMLTLFPSRLEPLGLVPLESMACESPVIGIAEAGIRETVIHNETGILTERDPFEFGSAINLLMHNTALREAMGKRGRERILKSWTWDQSYGQLEKNIERTLRAEKCLMYN